MDNNEKKLLEDLSDIVDSNTSFNEIVKKINYKKYKKEKKVFIFPKALTVAISLTACFILVILLIPNLSNNNQTEENQNPGGGIIPEDGKTLDEGIIPEDGKTPDDGIVGPESSTNPEHGTNIEVLEYEGFIKDSFEANIGDGPSYELSGPLPQPPVIDAYFASIDSTEENNVLYLRPFNYIYEVEYKNELEIKYVATYIEKQLANKIYEENKEIPDAPCAQPLDIVNGSVVDWFYSNSYYDEDKVLWYQYDLKDEIYSEIDGYICCGVYILQERKIVREIFSNSEVNLTDNIYKSLYFKNNGNKFLSAETYKINNSTMWYASDILINESNKNSLFDDYFSPKFNCIIDKEANKIKLETYAVQKEEELNKNYSESLKEYYILSNNIIFENDQPNKEFGQISYITYKYNEFVQLIQELVKNK